MGRLRKGLIFVFTATQTPLPPIDKRPVSSTPGATRYGVVVFGYAIFDKLHKTRGTVAYLIPLTRVTTI